MKIGLPVLQAAALEAAAEALAAVLVVAADLAAVVGLLVAEGMEAATVVVEVVMGEAASVALLQHLMAVQLLHQPLLLTRSQTSPLPVEKEVRPSTSAMYASLLSASPSDGADTR